MKGFRSLATISLLLVLVLLLVIPASAGGKPLHVDLDWRNVVPEGSGDPNGWADATVRINSGKGELCFEMDIIFFYSNSTERYAHIYKGYAGEIGPAVIDLGPVIPPLRSFTVARCLTADSQLLKTIQQNPEGYYLQVVTDTHPDGALRGQLSNSR